MSKKEILKGNYTVVPNELMKSAGISHTEFRLACKILSYSQPAFPSYKVIKKGTGLSNETIKRGIEKLISYNFIHVQKGGSCKPNKYFLKSRNSWKFPSGKESNLKARINFEENRTIPSDIQSDLHQSLERNNTICKNQVRKLKLEEDTTSTDFDKFILAVRRALYGKDVTTNYPKEIFKYCEKNKIKEIEVERIIQCVENQFLKKNSSNAQESLGFYLIDSTPHFVRTANEYNSLDYKKELSSNFFDLVMKNIPKESKDDPFRTQAREALKSKVYSPDHIAYIRLKQVFHLGEVKDWVGEFERKFKSNSAKGEL